MTTDLFAWPEVDERSAAAMCYTSGTTGNPKGVAYSHRSQYLHALAGTSSSTIGLSEADRIRVGRTNAISLFKLKLKA